MKRSERASLRQQISSLLAYQYADRSLRRFDDVVSLCEYVSRHYDFELTLAEARNIWKRLERIPRRAQ
jgi:hypothetical protein